MKSIVTFKAALACLSFLASTTLFAQVPQSFSYQSVIRDGTGELVANQQVGIQISILQGSATGTAVYTETHSPTTNANGLATLNIGEGTPSTGVFESINWGNGPYFVETSTDPAGGNNYSVSSVSQLLSVPYALYAANALSVETYFATLSTNINFPFFGIIDFDNVIQNSNTNVFERLPNGHVEIKKDGTISVNTELYVAYSGSSTLILQVFVNGVLVSRTDNIESSGSNIAVANSFSWPVSIGDIVEINLSGGGALNFIRGSQPWTKLNIQWIGNLY
jgi:hypothetical protein